MVDLLPCPCCSCNGVVLPGYSMVTVFFGSVALPAVVMAWCCLLSLCCSGNTLHIKETEVPLSYLLEVAAGLCLELLESCLQSSLPSKSRYRLVCSNSAAAGTRTVIVHCWSFQARSQNYEKLPLPSSCLSVRPSAWNNSGPTGWIFMKFDM